MANESIILQVDETTKQLMEEINGGLTDSITDKLRELEKIKDILPTIEEIQIKTNRIDDVLDLSEKSVKDFTNKYEEIKDSVSTVKQTAVENSQQIKNTKEQLASIQENQNLIIKQMNMLTQLSSSILKYLATKKNG